MNTDAKVATYYTREGLKETILQAVTQTAQDPDNLTARDFAALDEFHLGGLEATRQLAMQMELSPAGLGPGLRLLDYAAASC